MDLFRSHAALEMFLTHEMMGVALDRALEQCLLGLQVLRLLEPGHAWHRPYEVELEQEE
jgi:hypothetical protein